MRYSIQTPRLIIREWNDRDFTACRTLVTDPRVMRWVGRGVIWSDQQIHEFLWRQEQTSMALHFCLGPIVDRVTDRMIGIGGLQRLGQLPDVDLSIWLAPDHWGHGLATEAGIGILGLAFTKARLPRVIAIASPDHGAAIRVCEKLDMNFAGRFSGVEFRLAAAEVVMYGIDNPLRGVRPHPTQSPLG